MRKTEKTQQISEFDFFAISANMKKNSRKSTRLFKLDKLENTLHFSKKKVLLFLRFNYCTTRKPAKPRVICVFWWFKKVKS